MYNDGSILEGVLMFGTGVLTKTRRYDKKEDRANDKKIHDNPNHSGKRSNDRRLRKAEEQIKRWQQGRPL